MHGPARGGGGGVVWEIWKKYPAASQAKKKSSCIASPEEKKNHVCMVQPKKKFLQIISLSSKRFCLVSELLERPSNGIFDFGGARNETRAKKCINKIDCNK